MPWPHPWPLKTSTGEAVLVVVVSVGPVVMGGVVTAVVVEAVVVDVSADETGPVGGAGTR
jgi:hypothetical protein